MATRRVHLTYEGNTIKEPLIYLLGKKFKLITNIRGASISKELGLVTLEVEGEESEMEAGIAWLVEEGVKVEPIEMDVIE